MMDTSGQGRDSPGGELHVPGRGAKGGLLLWGPSGSEDDREQAAGVLSLLGLVWAERCCWGATACCNGALQGQAGAA